MGSSTSSDSSSASHPMGLAHFGVITLTIIFEIIALAKVTKLSKLMHHMFLIIVIIVASFCSLMYLLIADFADDQENFFEEFFFFMT